MTSTRVLGLVRVVVVAAAVALMWPASLGGATTLLVVRGTSMEPTYRSGDMLVVRSGRPRVGDVAVVDLAGGAGGRVVHRVVGVDDEGRLRTQGDNRRTADGFETDPADVVGVVGVRLPRVGTALILLSRWWSLALLVGAVATITLWERTAPPPRPPRRIRYPDEYRPSEAPTALP